MADWTSDELTRIGDVRANAHRRSSVATGRCAPR